MNEQNQRDSIMSMARGAFEERVDHNTEQGGQHNVRKNDRQNRQPEGDQDLRD